jgi:glycosyltransferase involved in cell wall biosynthesis
LRVLWISERFPPDRGGAAASAGRQVAALAPYCERLDVVRLSSEPAPGRVSATAQDGYTLHQVGRAAAADESLQLLAETARCLLDEGGHRIVHGFYAVHAGYVAATLARRTGRRSVVSLRGNDVDRAMFHGPRLPFLLWTLQHADAVLGVSRAIVETAAALQPRGYRTVGNGVDAELFCPGPEDLPSGLEGAPRPWLAFAGEARLKKGLPILQELAEALDRRQTGTLLLIGGVRAEETAAFREWKQRRPRVAARLREVGYLSDPARLLGLLRAVDLGVFPSLWEGMPNAALELMACAVPVLAAATGAFPELIEPGVSGFLVPPSRLDGFADEALRILELPAADRARIGAAARERVCRHFSPRAERDALLAVYRELLA